MFILFQFFSFPYNIKRLMLAHTPTTPVKIVARALASTNEYSLKLNSFDPSKSSPPNEFMQKLQMRMSHFHASKLESKDDKVDKE